MKTRKMMHKLLSLLLSCMMCLTMIPATALTVAAAPVTSVTTYDELYSAVHGKQTNIRLENDITYTCPDDVAGGGASLNFTTGDSTLDLNGHRLYFQAMESHPYMNKMFSLINVSGSASLTIKNGSILMSNRKTTDRDSRGPVEVKGEATFITENVNIENNKSGSVIYAHDTGKVVLNGGKLTSWNGYVISTYGGVDVTLNDGVELTVVSGNVGTPPQGAALGFGSLSMTGCTDDTALTIGNAKLTSGISIARQDVRDAAFDLSTHSITIGSTTVTKPFYTGSKVDFDYDPNKDDYFADAYWQANHLAKTASSQLVYASNVMVKEILPVLEGSVAIKGSVKYAGETVSADTSGITSTVDPANLRYQWQIQRDGVWENIEGATGADYVTVKTDGGLRVRVIVSAVGFEGSLTSSGRYITPAPDVYSITVTNGIAQT
ncbi:MAG: hypothetical protein KBS83_04570, partial [Lachnospiraceae bacterium]|nr:hypothetical protein [Candidatus Equihabitans merdae]